MGEYATDSLERDLYGFSGGSRFYRPKPEPNYLPFKSIKRETDKAWLLIMTGGNELWFPKRFCKIENNLIFLPKWLEFKIAMNHSKL